MTVKPRQLTEITPELRRRNALLAIALLVFAFGVATSVFVWRYKHNETAIPQGGSYAATYQIQHPQQ
jgi:hypothetical protein